MDFCAILSVSELHLWRHQDASCPAWRLCASIRKVSLKSPLCDTFSIRAIQLYDVLVLGAGPAGNTAALELARQGARVAVIDYRERIGDKLCTGVIGMECARKFPVRQRHIRREVDSALIHSPSGRCYTVKRDGPQALIVDRVAYVSEVSAEAGRSGADYFTGHRVTAVDRARQGVRVWTGRGPSSECFHSQLLLIATGFRSPVTQMVGLWDRSAQDFIFGQQVVVETNGVEGVEVFVGGAGAPESIGWIVPTSPDQGLVGTISRQKRPVCLDSLITALRREGRIEADVHEFSRWGIPVRPLARTFGTRMLVLGDAAGFTKPTTGGGIYYGMMSGRIASETALEALDSGDYSASALQQYERRWKREFGREMDIGYYARRLFEAMSNEQKDEIMRVFLSQEVQSEIVDSPGFSFDWHSRAILRTVSNRQIAKMIIGLGPAVAPLLTRLARAAAGN